MKFFRIILLVLFCTAVKAQTIRGVVLDSTTRKPIGGALVYFDNTFKKAVSDPSGAFEIVSPGSKFPIMVRSLGHHPKTVSTHSSIEGLRIYLTQKPIELRMVTVGFDGMDLAEKIRIFKREFLGTSVNARKCVIENIDDVNLVYDKASLTLTASANKPVVIHNKELGYRLNYYLTSFSYSPRMMSLVGNELFEEDFPDKEIDTISIKERRAKTYLGSRMHFIRSLWKNDLEKNNFKVYDINDNRLSYYDIVGVKDDQKFIRLIPIIKILYKNSSSFAQLHGEIFIDKNGFYSQGIIWRENISQLRVGDLLPFEYSIQRNHNEEIQKP